MIENKKVTITEERRVITKAPAAAPAATSRPFLLDLCMDSLTIKVIIKPGVKAKPA